MKWTLATDVPKDWEGKTAFQVNGWEGRPFWTRIPKGFSRDPRHCAGVFFCQIDLPSVQYAAHPPADRGGQSNG